MLKIALSGCNGHVLAVRSAVFTVFCAVFAEPFPTVLIVFFPAERADSFTAFFGCSTAVS